MVNIRHRIEKQKFLYNRLCIISNIMCFFGILGIILMIISNEIIFCIGHNEDTIISWSIKIIISISTIILIGLILYYHKLDLYLYSIKNSIEDWRIGLTIKKIILIISEILICSIHPFPRKFYSSIDIILSLLMFIRLYLICRLLMYHSYLINNPSSQSLSYLNQVSMNFIFLIKTYLEQWPTRCLLIFSICIFFIGSWALRACNYNIIGEHISIFDSMWLFIITFTTVGYGDLTPSTYCGRSVAAITSLIGVLLTALLISVLAQKLILTRWEKYVYNFVLNIQLSKERKNQAANIIKYSIKIWYLKRKNKFQTIQYIKIQWKLFRSIDIIQEIKIEQRKLIDNYLVLADLFTLQTNEYNKIEKFIQDVNLMKFNIAEKFNYINTTMNNIQNTLNIILNRMQ